MNVGTFGRYHVQAMSNSEKTSPAGSSLSTLLECKSRIATGRLVEHNHLVPLRRRAARVGLVVGKSRVRQWRD